MGWLVGIAIAVAIGIAFAPFVGPIILVILVIAVVVGVVFGGGALLLEFGKALALVPSFIGDLLTRGSGNGPYKGWISEEEYYGSIWLEGTYKDRKLDGPYEKYAESVYAKRKGSLLERGTYKNGELDGIVKKFRGGQLISKTTYREGVKHGLHEEWGDEGSSRRWFDIVYGKQNYEDGEPVGFLEQYSINEDGSPSNIPRGEWAEELKRREAEAHAASPEGKLEKAISIFRGEHRSESLGNEPLKVGGVSEATRNYASKQIAAQFTVTIPHHGACRVLERIAFEERDQVALPALYQSKHWKALEDFPDCELEKWHEREYTGSEDDEDQKWKRLIKSEVAFKYNDNSYRITVWFSTHCYECYGLLDSHHNKCPECGEKWQVSLEKAERERQHLEDRIQLMFNEAIVLETTCRRESLDSFPQLRGGGYWFHRLSTDSSDLVLKLGDWVNELPKFSVEYSEFVQRKEEQQQQRKAKEEKRKAEEEKVEHSRQIEENIDLGDFE